MKAISKRRQVKNGVGYPPEFPRRLADWGGTKTELAARYGVTRRTVHNWEQRAIKAGALTPQTPEQKKPKTIEQVEEETKESLKQEVANFGVAPDSKEFMEAVHNTEIKFYRQQIRNYSNSIHKHLAVTRGVAEAVIEAINPTALAVPPALPCFRGSDDMPEELAVLNLSDLHGGRVTPTFNAGVIVRRLGMLEEAVLRITSLLRTSYSLPNLRINCLGDFVENETLYGAQPFHIEFPLVQQVFCVMLPALERLFLDLSANFEQVTISAVPGNHGRNGKYASKITNWDLVLYLILQHTLRNIPNIRWEIACTPIGRQLRDSLISNGGQWNLTAQEWNEFFMLYSKPFLLYHGHGIPIRYRVPWYGIEDKVRAFAAAPGMEGFKVFCLGHFHRYFSTNANGRTVIANGSFVTDDEYSVEGFGAVQTPEQVFFGYSESRGITWQYRINVDDRPEDRRNPLLYLNPNNMQGGLTNVVHG